MKKYSFYFLVCFLFLLSCKPSTTEDQTDNVIDQQQIATALPKMEAMFVEYDSLTKKGGGPCTSEADCMIIFAKWPVLKGGKEVIRKIINDSVYYAVISNLEFSPDDIGSSIADVAKKWLADYKIAYKESNGNEMGWTIEVTGEMSLHDDKALLSLFNYTSTGGAHPNHYTSYTNFDTNTGAIIHYNDFVKDTTAFKNVVAKHFLVAVQERIGEEVSMEEFFWGESFQLPENFLLEKDSLSIIYNPYEAAAYAVGDIEFKIAFSDLKNSIRQ